MLLDPRENIRMPLKVDILRRFVPLSQFRDPRIAPHIKEDAMNLLDSVENLLVQGFYG